MRSDLIMLGRQLPRIYREAAQALQSSSVEAAMQHYADYGSYMGAGRAPDKLLPTLHAVCSADLTALEGIAEGPAESGDSSWTHQPEEGSHELASTSQSATPLEPRRPHTGVPAAEISWDIDLAAADADAGSSAMDEGIDWEIDAAPGSVSAAGEDPSKTGLDAWEIDVEGAAEAEPSVQQDEASADGMFLVGHPRM